MITEVEFWGPLAPIEETIIWKGQPFRVGFHILTVDEELDLNLRVHEFPEAQRFIAEGMLRAAYSVVTVNGKEVTFEAPTMQAPPGFEGMEEAFAKEMAQFMPNFGQAPTGETALKRKMDWIGRWKGVLLDKVLDAYREASLKPFEALAKRDADPNSVAGH